MQWLMAGRLVEQGAGFVTVSGCGWDYHVNNNSPKNMAGIFKAYDVRGTYPDQINEEMARKIGRVFSAVLDDDDRAESNTIVVGRDMREHSVPLQKALIEGLRAGGLDVLDIGLATTPMNYFAVGSLGAAGGVQVTASHNPAQYNGLKFSKRDAQPVSGDHGIPLMERLVESGEAPEDQLSDEDFRRIEFGDDV